MENSNVKIITPINILVAVLTFVGGWSNIVGYNLFMHTRPSSMTGRAAEIAESLATGDLKVFAYLISVVILFIIGVSISTVITRHFGFTYGLLMVVVILFGDIILVNNGHHLKALPILLSMAMGAQNGATSLTAISRTTHMTGATTELGTNIACKNWDRAIFWGTRWIFFPAGGILSYKFMGWIQRNNFKESNTLIIPMVIILCTAFIQKKLVDIQVLECNQLPRNKQITI